jgi:hypothetical protein
MASKSGVNLAEIVAETANLMKPGNADFKLLKAGNGKKKVDL